jgi:hypothetical protein
LIEECVEAHPFQLVQKTRDTLSLRVEGAEGAAGTALWHKAARALRGYLDAQRLTNIVIHRDPRPIAVDAKSGKLRRVISLH